MITLYSYPKCGTCRKAKKWLDTNGVSYEEIHLIDNPPKEEEIRSFVEKSGLDLKKFFNTSGIKYRELGLKDKLPDMTDDEKIAILASDGKLLKRPIAVSGADVTVGFSEEAYEQTWK